MFLYVQFLVPFRHEFKVRTIQLSRTHLTHIGAGMTTTTAVDEAVQATVCVGRDGSETSDGKTKRDKRDDFLTLDQPIFTQFFTKRFTKKVYLEHIHIPRQSTNSERFFESDICEALTKTYWWMTPAIWWPVAAVMCYISTEPLVNKCMIFAAGLFVWTIFEYVFHRFVFHCEEIIPDHPVFLMLHFFTHAVHHYFPFDPLRLAMPPALFIILATPTYCLFNVFIPTQPLLPLFGGIFFGFAVYDVIHFYLHHGAEKSSFQYIRSLRTYHAIHHYKEPDNGFGVTSKFWDHIFGTVIIPGQRKSAKGKQL